MDAAAAAAAPGARAGGRRAAAEEERRRQLQEYLAAKESRRQPRLGGGGKRPPLTEWSRRQRPDPSARGQKNVAPAATLRAAQAREGPWKVPAAGQAPPARGSRATASLQAKAALSLLPGKAAGPGGPKRPSKRPAGQPAEPASKQVATSPASANTRAGWVGRQAKRGGDKENRGPAGRRPPAQKRGPCLGRSLPAGPSPAPSEGPGEKRRQAAGAATRGDSQARSGRQAEGPAGRKSRERPGTAAPAPGARPPLRPGWTLGASGPALGSRGPPKPGATKPLGSAAELARGKCPPAQGGPPQPQAKGRPLAVLADGRAPRHSVAPRRNSASRGGIGQERSPARGAGQSKRKGWLAPRTPGAGPRVTTGAGPRVTTADQHPAAAAAASAVHGRRRSQSRLLTARRPRRPQTPSPSDRRKLLEEWLASRGRTYKRPPMTLPTAKRAKGTPEGKAALNLSFWRRMEEEEEEEEGRTQRLLASGISSTLAECLALAKEGLLSEELLASLARIPEVETSAQFWACKARLLARGGPVDVAGLYQAALRSGAAPLQELRDALADILKDTNKVPWALPTQGSLLAGEAQAESSPQGWRQGPTGNPASAVKIQVVPLFRGKERGARPQVQLLTPVRRSLRIERAAACYPPMLKDHHPVVSSLDEMASTDPEGPFLFRDNEALLERVGPAALFSRGQKDHPPGETGLLPS